MKRILALFAIILFLFGIVPLNSCTKNVNTIVYRDTTINIFKDTTIDKQIYLAFLYEGINTISTTPVFAGEIPLFNKKNYVGVDSVIFFCTGYNYPVNPGGTVGSLVIQLYDKTDDKIIGGSEISINEPAPATLPDLPFHASINLADSIPDKPIDLQILVNSSSSSNRAATGESFIILYRK